MVNLLRLTLVTTAAWLGATTPSWADGKKFALIIANGAYGDGLSPLTNPPQDATIMTQALQNAGFAVTIIRDANLETMRTAVCASASNWEPTFFGHQVLE